MKYLFIIFLSITFLNSCGEKIDLGDVIYSDLKMDIYEVTAREFKQCTNSGACVNNNYYTTSQENSCNLDKIGYENHPMNCINWFGANEYCKWKGKRLPTEEEWVYFAKGGENYKYAGSNNPDEVAWYSDNSGLTTHQVGTKAANGYGLYDMSGNVWEWINSWYDTSNQFRLLHGGGFNNYFNYILVDYRDYSHPSNISRNYGFRCVQDE